MSIASMVLGILSMLCCTIFVAGILALVFGFVGINQIKSDPRQKGRGMAIAGIVLGGSSILIGIIVWIFGDANFNVGNNQFGN